MREGTPDTVPHPPIMPSHNPNRPMTESDVEALIDRRLREYDAATSQRRTSARIADVRQRVMTYGISGVIGAAAGAGCVLLIQRSKKSSGHKP